MSAYCFRPRVFELPVGVARDGGELLAKLSGERRPVLLDSAAGEPRCTTLLGFNPLPPEPPQAWAEWRAFVGSLAAAPGDAVPGPFHGGFIGALAYDLGVAGERQVLPAEPWGWPLIAGGLYTDFVVRDEVQGRAWLVLGEEPGDGRASVAERRDHVMQRLQSPRVEAVGGFEVRGPLQREVGPAEHCARVERVRQEIARGEIYQANLAHRFLRAVAGDPIELYLRLRRTNPAPYMGYLDLAQGALISSSPELLLESDGKLARTRPIKGTAARSADSELDRLAAQDLLKSEKDLAELAMIVDLERNDLGRTAERGSVRVEQFPRLQSYARVHHLMADVVSQTRAGLDSMDVLSALFPGGSITGAPKLRSMEIIAREEKQGRGFFCGSLGFMDLRGHALWNILIRTLLWRPLAKDVGPDGMLPGEVSYRVGGGITWGSDPAAEDAETLDKGAALAAAMEGPSQE